MKRLYVGFTLLLYEFVYSLDFQLLYLPTSWALWVLVLSAVLTTIFVRSSRIDARLSSPTPGMTIFTVGLVIYLLRALLASTVLAWLMSLPVEAARVLLIALSIGLASYSAGIKFIAIASMLLGTFRLFASLMPENEVRVS